MGEKNISETKLILRFANGVNEQNEPVYKDVTFSRITEAATDEAVKAVGIALAPLYGAELVDVVRLNSVSLGK